MKQINVVMKKIEGNFEAALFIDGKFTRTASGPSMPELFARLTSALLLAPFDEDVEFGYVVNFIKPEAPKNVS